MTIHFEDAIERARLMSDEAGLMPQESYNMLVRELDEKDRYPFSMALMERGISVRTGSLRDKEDTLPSLEGISSKMAQDATSELDLEDYEEGTLKEFQGSPELDDMREVLEREGISISPEGKVSFYSTGTPGMFKDRIPQILPLKTVVALWEQKIGILDREISRMSGMLDEISVVKSMLEERLRNKKSPLISEIRQSLSELSKYQFSDKSKSETTQGLLKAIEAVKSDIMTRKYVASVGHINEAQEFMSNYLEGLSEDASRKTEVHDVLSKINSMMVDDPDSFKYVTEGIGGISAMSRIAAIVRGFA